MMIRLAAGLACTLMLENSLQAHDRSPTAEVGDLVAIELTGDLASEYARRIGFRREEDPPLSLQTKITARIAQRLRNGRFRIEHVASVTAGGGKIQLVTLTVIVNREELATTIRGNRSAIFTSVTDEYRSTRSHALKLCDFKGLRLRTWNLAEEIDD